MGSQVRPPARSLVQIDNERVIVTEWCLPPGGHTGTHAHQRDYLIVPVTSGELEITVGTSVSRASMAKGATYIRTRGIEHDVTNVNEFDFIFVEIEFKD